MGIKNGASAFATEFQNKYGKEATKGSKEEYQKLLEKYFNVSKEEQKRIFEIQNSEETPGDEDLNTYMIYKFLLATREYTLFGFYTSEHVGENILSYDPIPGSWEPCIPVEEVGNAWSL